MSDMLIARRGDALERDEPPPLADEELLRRFLAHRDERAFAALVTRHGPLVMAVCRRVLRREQDAEDAFQATFLVLARKAASLRQAPSLAAWLHRTAHRLALRARAVGVRRREQQLESDAMIAAESLASFAAEYNQSVLDEELNRLPEKYRLPLFLCAIEGKSREEAAGQLGWSLGSVKGRLERGRQILRRRLMLRGVSLAIGLAAAQAQHPAQAAVSASLVASTAQAGVQYAAGAHVVGYVSKNALALAKGSYPMMSLATVKLTACSLAAVSALAWGASWLPRPALAGGEGSGAIVLHGAASLDAASLDADAHFVALLAEDQQRGSAEDSRELPSRRDGEGPPKPGPRDGEAPPRTGPRDGEGPPRTGPRDGEGPPRRGPREGERGALENFRPQTQREAALLNLIRQLQREVAELRRQVEQVRSREGGRETRLREREGAGDRPREGAGEREADRAEPGPRDED